MDFGRRQGQCELGWLGGTGDDPMLGLTALWVLTYEGQSLRDSGQGSHQEPTQQNAMREASSGAPHTP